MESLLKNSKKTDDLEKQNYFVFQQVKKRNGLLVDFSAEKIMHAILKAGRATNEFDKDIAKQLAFKVLCLIQVSSTESTLSVEEIQDYVEEVLLSSVFKKTAKAYIIYRDQHSRIREFNRQKDINRIDSYIENLDWQVNENSNMCFSLQGLNNYISNEVTKNYWLHKIYPKEIRKKHETGEFHIHDLGLLSVYCVGWDLKDLLYSGFQGVSGKSESLPAKHFRSALGQIVNFFYTLQGEAAGAQAFSNFDTLLAPFVRYDDLSFKEVKQAIQEFVFNLNVATRVGFQTPFTNITMDLKVPDYLKNEPVIIGGELQNETYTEFQHEMNLINKAFLEVLSNGDAKGRVFTFPIPTYNITKDFDFEDEAYDLLWDVTAKYGIPYFANFINSDMNPSDARSMCCRLRLDLRKLDKKGGGLFGSNPLTGSIGVVTINIPRISYQSKSEKEFFKELKNVMALAKDSLEIKRKVLENYTQQGLYPYTQFYLRNVKERHQKFWKNHFSTIGLIGVHEACEALLGVSISDTKGKEFSEKVLVFMREELKKFQNDTGNNYNLEATPAEGTSHRLADLDKEEFGNLQVKQDYYTNSTQLPVDYSDDIFGSLEHQKTLQSLYTGGTVFHSYLGEALPNSQSVKRLVQKICHNYPIPYLTISPSFSICPNHGYLRGEVELCPECNSVTEIYSRVVGYIRPLKQWNKGKINEFKNRVKYSI